MALEAIVLKQSKELLRILRSQGKLTFRRIHSVAVPRGNFKAGTGRFSVNRDMAGMTDLQIYLPNAITLHAEGKSTKGRLSEEQELFRDDLQRFGHHWFLFRSLDDLIDALESFGVETGLKRRGDGVQARKIK